MRIRKDLFLDEWIWIRYGKNYLDVNYGGFYNGKAVVFKDYEGKKYLVIRPWELHKLSKVYVNTIFGRIRFDNLCIKKEPDYMKVEYDNPLVTKFMPKKFCGG